jgi:XRE family transcriptional regulator, fatty acid utilization regulator
MYEFFSLVQCKKAYSPAKKDDNFTNKKSICKKTYKMLPSFDTVDRKLFAGARLKRLRGQLALTQTRMADELGVSVSYLNLIERNQRPLSAQFLMKLAEVYTIDLRDFSSHGDEQLRADLSRVLQDPQFADLSLSRDDMQEAVQSAPGLVRALLRAHSAQPSTPTETAPESLLPPLERVRDVIQARGNHFPELDEQAESLAEELKLGAQGLFAAASERLRQRHGITARLLPFDVMPDALRRFDQHSKQLRLSELLDGNSRGFHAAYQLGLLEAKAAMDRVIAEAALSDDAARRLLRVNLGNYFAAAVMMPYGKFHAAAEATGYDLTLLGTRFGAGFEQVCHRLTTLQRPTARGVPFGLLRVDEAGTISKRFGGARFPFAKSGGNCALWTLHSAFRTPGKLITQVMELPDGNKHFSVARTVRSHWGAWGAVEPSFAIALVCELRFARHLTYARGLDLDSSLATPIGPACTACSRTDCRQRALPMRDAPLIVDERTRGVAPIRFLDPIIGD